MTRFSLLSFVCVALSVPAQRNAAAADESAPPAVAVNIQSGQTLDQRAVPDGGSVLLAGATRNDSNRTYQIAFKIVELREDTDINALAIHVHPFQKKKVSLKAITGGRYHTFTKMNCSACHSVQGQAELNQLFWNSFLNHRGALQTWVRKSQGVKVLAEPQLVTTQDRITTFVAGGERKLQYFRRLKKGIYSLEEDSVQIGISSKFKVQEAGNGTVRLNPLAVSVSAIIGREKLTGADLPAGKPIVKKVSVDTSLVTKLGKSSVISIDSPNRGRVLIFIKVSLVQPGQLRIEKRGAVDSKSKRPKSP